MASPMSEMFEPWRVQPSARPRSIDVDDRDGDLVCSVYFPGGANLDVVRRMVACVNALRGISLESIERMRPELWPRVIAESWAEVKGAGAPSADDLDAVAAELVTRALTAPAGLRIREASGKPDAGLRIREASTTFEAEHGEPLLMVPGKPERVIEYEVEGHPWASEEGCAPCVAGLDDAPAAAVRVLSHEQAAKEYAEGAR